MKIGKKISYIAPLVAALLISNACSDSVLDVKPVLATEANYFKTEDNFKEGVFGLYSKLVYFYNYRNGADFVHDTRLLADDDLTTVDNNAYEIFTSQNADQSHNGLLFQWYYQIIGRANIVLDIMAAKGETVYKNKDLMANNKGEILFMRGFSFFNLWNYFGVSPVVTTRFDGNDPYPANSTGNQLLDQAIADLKEGAPLLPAKWGDDDLGRITQEGAYAMLGKALLYRATVTKSQADYAAAIAAFDKVTTRTLVPNFGDNFSTKGENNKESLFEVQLGRCAASACNPWLDNDSFQTNGDASGYWGFFGGHWSLFGKNLYKPTQSFLNFMPKDDPRYLNSITEIKKYDSIKQEWVIIDWQVQKYVEGYGGYNGNPTYYNNARVIRLADVKLMKAEAIIQSGGSTAEAIALINEIRTRARKSVSPEAAVPANLDETESDPNTVMKWIIDERRLELAFEEGHRWFDLRRWHMAGILTNLYGKDLNTWDFSSKRGDEAFKEKNLYLPIPTYELQLNPNLAQNPVWK